MVIDLRTLVIVLGFTHLLQVVVFLYQFRVNKTYQGIGWWLMWSGAEVIGFTAMLCRSIPGLLNEMIIVQNTFIVAGTVFIYAGVQQFFDRKVNFRIIIPLCSLFLSSLLFFLFIHDDIRVRAVIINVTLAAMGLLTAYSLLVKEIGPIKGSTRFNATVFLFHSAIFIYRTVKICTGAPVDNIFEPTMFNTIIFFDAIIVGLLWTFGFIIMLNQRLNTEMAEAKEDLHIIFNTSPDAAIIARLEDGEIVDSNIGYTKITGFTREELTGKSTLDINIWKDIADRQNVVNLLKSGVEVENYEAVFVRKDGVEITGLMSAKLITLKGRQYIISISRDISERKKMEESLRESNAEKDKFFSILAHDLRSPFNAFLGFTQLMAEELPSMTLDQIQQIAVRMRKSATNLYGLLENLLEWSRFQRGNIGFNRELISVSEVVATSLEAVQESAVKKGITIHYAFPEDMMVSADLHMLATILRNMVSNSVKYTPRGGAITIGARAVNGDGHEFRVQDSGIGISDKIKPNIFILDSTTNRRGTEGEPSTGLGLIICREFVEKHGGKIWVESKEGEGSSFYFTLGKG